MTLNLKKDIPMEKELITLKDQEDRLVPTPHRIRKMICLTALKIPLRKSLEG